MLLLNSGEGKRLTYIKMMLLALTLFPSKNEMLLRVRSPLNTQDIQSITCAEDREKHEKKVCSVSLFIYICIYIFICVCIHARMCLMSVCSYVVL
jgi:hypothetical protein